MRVNEDWLKSVTSNVYKNLLLKNECNELATQPKSIIVTK